MTSPSPTSSAGSSRSCCWPCSRACSGRGSCCGGCRSTRTRSAPRPSRGWSSPARGAIPAQLAALVCAVGFGGVLERVQRTRRIDPDAAIGLLLVAALAIGVVLASDVYHSGAGVDRLLFGSLIALTPLDLWLTAAAAVAALVCDAALRRSWLATGFDPDGARSVGVRVGARRPAAAARGRGRRGGRARRRRRAAGDRRPDRPGGDRAAVRAGAARAAARDVRARRGRGPGCDRGSPTASTSAPAPRWPCSAPRSTAVAALVAAASDAGQVGGMSALVTTRDLRGGYVRGVDVLGGVEFTVAAGEIAAVLGPNGGGKTTLFRALLGELPFRTGEVELAGRPAYVPQTEGARLDFPVSAHDVALMGAYGRTPWFKRVAREDRAQGRRGARARRARRAAPHARFGTPERRPAPARPDRPRARPGRAAAAARRAAVGRRPPERGADRARLRRAAGRGPRAAGGDPRRRAGARVAARAVPQPRPGRVRGAGEHADAPTCCAATYGDELVILDGAAPGRAASRTTTTRH